MKIPAGILAAVLIAAAQASWSAEASKTEAPKAEAPKAADRVAPLIESLKSKDEGERLKAAKELAKLGPDAKAAVPLLTELAQKDPDEDVRRVAGQALEKIKAPDTAAEVARLIEALKDKDVAVRFKAAKDLANLGAAAKAAVPALTELAQKDPDEDVRRVAGQAREKIQPAAQANNEAVAALVKQLKDADVGVRFKAVKELAKLGAAAKPALPALTEAAKDADEDVRLAAKSAMDKVEAAVKEAGVQEQIALLKDKDVATRLAAAKDLAAMGPSARVALPALQAALNDPDEDVRNVAARAIAKISGTAAPEVVGRPLPMPNPMPMPMPVTRPRTVFDDGKLFKEQTVEQASALIFDIAKTSGLPVRVETFASLPPNVKTADELLIARTKALNSEGILIVLVKNPGSLRTHSAEKSLRQFSQADLSELSGKAMLPRLRSGDFDNALLDGLKFIQRKTAAAGTPAPKR